MGEIHPHQHVARGAEKNNGGQDQEFAPVGADGSRIHRSAPPFRLGMAEQQLVPALPRRMALRPYFEPVKEQTNEDQASQNAHDQLDGQFVGGR